MVLLMRKGCGEKEEMMAREEAVSFLVFNLDIDKYCKHRYFKCFQVHY